MVSKLIAEPGIDPRIKTFFGDFDPPLRPDVASREELLALRNTPEAKAASAAMQQVYEAHDKEWLALSGGLIVTRHELQSQPDGNTINIQFIRPDADEALPCVYHMHGGGMVENSCWDGNYRAWGRMIARQGVAVAMVDFRNALVPSSVPEVAPYPAGLNDCVSGLRWLVGNASSLGVDSGAIIAAGESGGGNLTLALGMRLLREGDSGLVQGLYALCPGIAPGHLRAHYPSFIENEGIFVRASTNHGEMAYGIAEFEARNPLAWPGFATVEDVRGLPPTMISVNEFDPARDEGVAFYRLLLEAGVSAYCRQVMGTTHGIEIFPRACPEISRETARSIADFCKGVTR